jgi:hypothetical protein
MALLGAIALGCETHDDRPYRKGKSPKDKETTDTTIDDTEVPEDTAPEPQWQLVPPDLDAEIMVRGEIKKLKLYDLPDNASVTFYTTRLGMAYDSSTDEATGLTLDLIGAELLGTAVADETGTAKFEIDVPIDAPTGPVYFQAVATDPATGISTVPHAVERTYAIPESDAATTFTKAGWGMVYNFGNSHTGGAAFIDYNNDFWPDLFVTNGGGGQHYLFRNDGDGSFTDVSELVAKPDIQGESAGVKFADFDNDGDQDLLIPGDSPVQMNASSINPHEGGPNLYYENQGNSTFIERGAELGDFIDPRGWRTGTATLSDIDRDGFVDVYMGSWAMLSEPLGVMDNDDRMLRNTMGEAGGFTDITSTTGTDGQGRDALSVIFWDMDHDLWPDLYVGNVGTENSPPDITPDDLIYRNDGGLQFTDVTNDFPGVRDDAQAIMGIDIGDLDNDGYWDMYLTDVWEASPPLPLGNALYMGQADGELSDNVCRERGVCTGYISWPVSFADFDNDGWSDLFVGTGWRGAPDLLYINRRDGTFEHHDQKDFRNNSSRGGTAADYDGDGDVDLFVACNNNEGGFYSNDFDNANRHWLEFKLFGTVSNRSAIGAVLRITTADGSIQMRRVTGGDSAHSQSTLQVHVGLGLHSEADVEITWPSGTVQLLEDVAADNLRFVDESQGLLSEALSQTTATFRAADNEIDVRIRSSFGGRTGLLADGLGTLAWQSETGDWFATFPMTSHSGTVTILSNRGGSWPVPIVDQ